MKWSTALLGSLLVFLWGAVDLMTDSEALVLAVLWLGVVISEGHSLRAETPE